MDPAACRRRYSLSSEASTACLLAAGALVSASLSRQSSQDLAGWLAGWLAGRMVW